MSTNGDVTCAVLSDGTVQCWGDNSYSQLGNGTMAGSSVPVMVAGISNAVAVAVGHSGVCVLLSGGTVQCWGGNSAGELGNGTWTASSAPVTVAGITNAVGVVGGAGYACALLSGRTVQCWGDNSVGELGNGTTATSSVPVTVSSITNAVAISSEGWGGRTICALLGGGTVQCWGWNIFGQLGDGTKVDHSPVPVTVSGIANAIAVAAGAQYSCALLSGGTVQCWGTNSSCQLGNGTTAGSSVPVPVFGITNATAVAAGQDHACAISSDGAVQCWGDNEFGELGNGTTATTSPLCSPTPVRVLDINYPIVLAVGESSTYVILTNGEIWSWGYNYSGQLGSGTHASSSVPVRVTGF
jgi:alpha-tubulin suppressor-like RCC1 family protein